MILVRIIQGIVLLFIGFIVAGLVLGAILLHEYNNRKSNQ